MNKLSFACTALVGATKVGVLKPDENGYYDLILGALDFPNSYGAEYTSMSAKELFKASSSLIRRINNGYCRSEYGHPKREPGMTDSEFMMRVMRIEETRVCAHIKQAWIDTESIKDAHGRRVIAIRGLVKPAGPYGDTLVKQFQNPDENVAFSIRSITDDELRGGKHLKHLREIVTWDYVTEPGLSIANKYMSPSLEESRFSFEEFDSVDIPLEIIAAKISNANQSGLSMESVGMLSAVVRDAQREHTLRVPNRKTISSSW